MVQSDLDRFIGTKLERLSHGQFDFIVETFHDTHGKSAFGTQPVQQQFAVIVQTAGHFLHRHNVKRKGCTETRKVFLSVEARATLDDYIDIERSFEVKHHSLTRANAEVIWFNKPRHSLKGGSEPLYADPICLSILPGSLGSGFEGSLQLQTTDSAVRPVVAWVDPFEDAS